jgi:hypothetical protein
MIMVSMRLEVELDVLAARIRRQRPSACSFARYVST